MPAEELGSVFRDLAIVGAQHMVLQLYQPHFSILAYVGIVLTHLLS